MKNMRAKNDANVSASASTSPPPTEGSANELASGTCGIVGDFCPIIGCGYASRCPRSSAPALGAILIAK